VGAATPAVQLNSIFSAKTDPRENPEKNPGIKYIITTSPYTDKYFYMWRLIMKNY
jgi:hypothetical protein